MTGSHADFERAEDEFEDDAEFDDFDSPDEEGGGDSDEEAMY